MARYRPSLAPSAQEGQRVSIMTLHAAKGLEFEIVFLPGWEEGLFPHQRSLDDNGRAGLEEERRLAYVGLTRARREAKIYHAANRRVRGLWQTSLPSRFIGELPAEHVEFEDAAEASAYGGYGVSRFDAVAGGLGSRYNTPGWRRAEARSRRADESGPIYARAGSSRTLEGQAQGWASRDSPFRAGSRVFHLKFGPGSVVGVDGQKLTVDFDRAGRKLVMDSFVTAEA